MKRDELKDSLKDPVHIGERIRSLRVHKGLTQVELAELLGTDQQRISLLERRASTQVKTLQKIADATGAELLVEFIP